MKKVIFSKFDKQAISQLPRVLFGGRIIVVQSKEEADKAVAFLLSQTILGIDTETRPAFKKGQTHKVSLLQVSTNDTCFLFRLNMIGMTSSIKYFLEDSTVPKIGLSLGDDVMALQKRGNFIPGNFIDLQDHVKEIGIQDLGLAKLYANIFGQRISKREQLTNWDADVLTEKQKRYAATDAWACIQLYEEFNRLKKDHAYQLVTVQEERQSDALKNENK